MTPTLGCALALLLCALAGPSLAAPNPYATVPADRAARATPADSTDRVFGGEPVPDGLYPFQVALLRASDLDDTAHSQYKAQFCGGTLEGEPEMVAALSRAINAVVRARQ